MQSQRLERSEQPSTEEQYRSEDIVLLFDVIYFPRPVTYFIAHSLALKHCMCHVIYTDAVLVYILAVGGNHGC